MPPVGRGRGRGQPQLNLDDNQPAVPNLPAAMLALNPAVQQAMMNLLPAPIPLGQQMVNPFPNPFLNPFVPMNPGAGPIVNAPIGAGQVPIPPPPPPVPVVPIEQDVAGDVPRDAPSEDILY